MTSMSLCKLAWYLNTMLLNRRPPCPSYCMLVIVNEMHTILLLSSVVMSIYLLICMLNVILLLLLIVLLNVS